MNHAPPELPTKLTTNLCVLVAFLAIVAGTTPTLAQSPALDLQGRFETQVKPFLADYCLNCHDNEEPKADLDLSGFNSSDAVVTNYAHWELVFERLKIGDMPPAKAKKQPSPELRQQIIQWTETLRDREAQRNAGDPGPIPARRLSNAEYDYTIRDLTGVDIRPTRAFPVDPGFDNSGESLAMSPALVKKYLQAAREVAEHLVLTPDGFTFAPHPVVAETDRDKWAVFRIVDFYRRQPTDYADYFRAAWEFKHRAALGFADKSLAQIAAQNKLSAKFLQLIWTTLNGSDERLGPIAKVQQQWSNLPNPTQAKREEVQKVCEEMRDYVVRLRGKIVPEVKNLTAPPIHNGSQTMVMWKNRQMAANRRRFDTNALLTAEAVAALAASTNKLASATNNVPRQTAGHDYPVARTTNAPSTDQKSTNVAVANNTQAYGTNRPRRVQAPTPEIVQKGGFSLPPVVVTTASSATARMAALKKRGVDPDLLLPENPEEHPKYFAAFARFAEVFPDDFYITERARVYLDAEKEQENAGRLLSAGLHSMTGYFRDDGPLYDLILDEAGQKELDRLWQEFDFYASVPQRMHTSLVWFERTDSAYLRDPVFDPFRPEDKSVTTQEKIRALGELYLAKAQRNNASETAQEAIRTHFNLVASNIAQVEASRLAAEPLHVSKLEEFAQRAYRRPLSDKERDQLRRFYQQSRQENGVDHEEAMRDCIVRVLMSPSFCFRADRVEAADIRASSSRVQSVENKSANRGLHRGARSLSGHAIASRLSYFLWASMPDQALLQRASELHDPEVLRQEVRRMLKDSRVKNFVTEFSGNWLDFRRFEQHNSVDRERFPVFNNELRQAMFEEPIHFFLDVAQRDRSILDFLYARDTFVNPTLGKHYGIEVGHTNATRWIRVEDARQFGRGGLLPMSVFLTVNSPGLRTSPVKRGNWVVKRILGERIPPPPPAVPELPSDEKAMGTLTVREVLAKHREHEACAGCHARFDSFGLVFESYGPVGERREKDFGGRAVDTRADFPNGSEGVGLSGLLDYIEKHREADFVDNFSRKLLAYGLGRTLILSDEPLITEMKTVLRKENYRFSSLIEAIVTSPQFLSKRANTDLARR
jgi:hypothetical protein